MSTLSMVWPCACAGVVAALNINAIVQCRLAEASSRSVWSFDGTCDSAASASVRDLSDLQEIAARSDADSNLRLSLPGSLQKLKLISMARNAQSTEPCVLHVSYAQLECQRSNLVHTCYNSSIEWALTTCLWPGSSTTGIPRSCMPTAAQVQAPEHPPRWSTRVPKPRNRDQSRQAIQTHRIGCP